MDPLTLLLAASVFTLIGVIAGIATGLIPGLHVNNVALASVALQGSLISLAMFLFGWADPTLEESLLIVSTLIIGNVVTHTFLDFIPSVLAAWMKCRNLSRSKGTSMRIRRNGRLMPSRCRRERQCTFG